MSTRVLVTGGSGQVGSAVVAALTGDAGLHLAHPSRAELDLDQPGSLAEALDRAAPALIIHCAAWTAVDRAEQEPEACARANTEAPSVIARWCAEHGAAMLHVSTDYVFDGARPEPYLEDSPTSPLQVYGRTKRDAETEILDALPAAAILRVSGVYDATRRNFVTAILARARSGQALSVVADQVTAPTSASSIATLLGAIARAAVQHAQGPAAYLRARRGIFHASSTGAVSWFEFARQLVARAAAHEPALRAVSIAATTAAAYGAPAPRPAHVILGGTRLEQDFGLTRTSWEEQLDDVMASIAR